MAFDLEKLKDNHAIFWVFMFPKIREVAAQCGWAIGVHGSVANDLDLMAMAWVEKHTTADELADAIAKVVTLTYRKPIKNDKDKPNNRVVYTIFAGNTYIDLNVIDNNKDILQELKQLSFSSNAMDYVKWVDAKVKELDRQ